MTGFQAKSLRKCFGGSPALEDVSLEVRKGEIHALLGENGAGKTTLLNILYGLLAPDSGQMLLDGEPYAPRSPREAKRAGVGMVHQHFMLVPTLAVGENILLGEQPFSSFRPQYDFGAIRERMSALGFDFPLEARTDTLSVGEMQRVEIFKALWKGASLLALDEPTAMLTPRETESLFELLRGIRERGQSVLFISHKLEEIERLADRVSVLRRGRSVGCFEVAETNRAELSRLMIGRELSPPAKSPTRAGESVSVSDGLRVVCSAACSEKLRGPWSFEAPFGHITAIAGIEGNGQRELAENLLGLRNDRGLEVSLAGKRLPKGVRDRVRGGISFISEDRQRTGLVLEFTLRENLALKDISEAPWSRHGLLRIRGSKARADDLVQRFEVHPPDLERAAGTLSGGNQQKVVVAREITRPHRLLVATNPTRGLDVGAREAVHRALIADAEAGAAIVLISTELEEALELADSLQVICKGRLEAIPRERWNEESLGLAMLGASKELSAA